MPALTTAAVPSPSALTRLINSSHETPDAATALCTQILHNLRFQHLWRDIRIQPPRSIAPTQRFSLLFGRPPTPVYTHPDEQAFALEHGIQPAEPNGDKECEQENTHKVKDGASPSHTYCDEYEWVLPTAQDQMLTLRQLAEVFDALPERERGPGQWTAPRSDVITEFDRRRREDWAGKRILLAMVSSGMGGDGTVVYYIIMEGAVKPRQN